MIYGERDGHDIPILITELEGDQSIVIELRSFRNGKMNGGLYHIMTWDQARLLRDRLSEWLLEHPKTSGDE